MSVRAVTPRVVAISGHVAFYRDRDFYDVDQDAFATGNPYDPEWPDKPLRLNLQRHDLADRGAAAGATGHTPSSGPGRRGLQSSSAARAVNSGGA